MNFCSSPKTPDAIKIQIRKKFLMWTNCSQEFIRQESLLLKLKTEKFDQDQTKPEAAIWSITKVNPNQQEGSAFGPVVISIASAALFVRMRSITFGVMSYARRIVVSKQAYTHTEQCVIIHAAHV